MVKVPLDYPIGSPGQPWGPSEKRTWLSSRQVRRSYHDDVVRPLYDLLAAADDDSGADGNGNCCPLPNDFEIVQYGELHVPHGDEDGGDVNQPSSSSSSSPATSTSSTSLPLLAVKSKTLASSKPTVLVTGGTHGYETSGVLGALSFLASGKARHYHEFFNLVVVPCVCPWGYEREERWVAEAVDPNRSFEREPSDNLNGGGDVSGELLRTRESNQLIEFLDSLRVTCTAANGDGGTIDAINNNSEECDKPLKWLCHMDLHETTDSDFTEFRPAKAARDGGLEYDDHIPDGFYLVGDSERMEGELSTEDDPVSDHSDGEKLRKQLQMGFYQAILNAVERVTHIAEMEDDTDGHGKKLLSGYPAESKGLILVPCRPLGLCAGGAVPSAEYLATTEVYPDSERTNGEECTSAQVASVCGGLDYLLETVVGSK